LEVLESSSTTDATKAALKTAVAGGASSSVESEETETSDKGKKEEGLNKEKMKKEKEVITEKKGEAIVADDDEEEEHSSSASSSLPASVSASVKQVAPNKPFQHLQFLVRDWQNFDHEYHEPKDGKEQFNRCYEEMQHYLKTVLKPRNASDLQSTREQITRCFDKLDCFLLPHPGKMWFLILFRMMNGLTFDCF
jgi:hypothetical protein